MDESSQQETSLVGDNIHVASLETPVLCSVTLSIGVRITCETKDEQERLDDELEAESEHAIASGVAVTKFPAWVRMYYVKKIRDLNCLETVREMVLSGVPLIEIARHIHSLGEADKLALDTLRMYLEHFKATLPAWLMAARQQPKQFLDIKKKADETVDVLTELNRLYLWTKERLEIGIAQERRFGLLSNGMDRNFAIASRLLDQIVEVKDRLGMNNEQMSAALPKHLSDQVDWSRIYARESVQKVMSSPEKRSRVVQVAERLFDMYANKISPEHLEKILKKEVKEPKDVVSGEVDDALDILNDIKS